MRKSVIESARETFLEEIKKHEYLNTLYDHLKDVDVFDEEKIEKAVNSVAANEREREFYIKSINRIKEGVINAINDINDIDIENEEKRLLYGTSHIPIYELISNYTTLYGDEYRIIKKGIFYALISTVLQNKSTIRAGNVRSDCRIHYGFCMPTGNGKGAIIDTLNDVLTNFGKRVVMPASFHPEGLVGKVKIVKVKKKSKENVGNVGYEDEIIKPIPGLLENDVLLLNESKELLISNNDKYKESRAYLSMALDRYLSNYITKKMVDVSNENSLKYTPHCNCYLFYQPYPIPKDIILQGFLRRFLIIYVPNLLEDDNYDALIEKLTGTIFDYEDIKRKIVKFLEEVRIKTQNIDVFTISPSALTTATKLTLQLVFLGSVFSEGIWAYVKSIAFTIQELLLKHASVWAAIRGDDSINEEDIEKAFIDLVEFLYHHLLYIQNKTRDDDFTYGELWRGAKGRDRRILEWLYLSGATSKESTSLSIADLKYKITEEFGISERQAERYIKNYKDRGWIKVERGFQSATKVWLAFIPEIKKDKERFDWDLYYKLCKKYGAEGVKNEPTSPEVQEKQTESKEQEQETKEVKEEEPTPLKPDINISDYTEKKEKIKQALKSYLDEHTTVVSIEDLEKKVNISDLRKVLDTMNKEGDMEVGDKIIVVHDNFIFLQG